MVRKIAIALWYALTATLAVSTFCTSDKFYGSLWFIILWIAVAICIIIAIKFRLSKHNIPASILHSSLLLILAGGAITWLTGDIGTIYLTPDKDTDKYISDNGQAVCPLHATIRLDSFVVKRYSGLESPLDFTSYVTVNGKGAKISVNKPLTIDGIRLYQTSYRDGGSSILTVNTDLWGMTLSYAGYIMLGIGWILTLSNPAGRFRKTIKALSVIAILFFSPFRMDATNSITAEQAERMSMTPVIYNGRIAPFNTPATELIRKLTGKSSFRGASAEQITASMILYPDDWQDVSLLYVKDSKLRSKLGMDSEYTSLSSLFDNNGNYILSELYGGTGSGLDRSILELDEKVELMHKVQSGQLFLPAETTDVPILRFAAERLNNSIPFTKAFFMAMLSIAILSVLTLSYNGAYRIIMWIAAAAILWQIAGYAIRWIIAERIPLSTGGETLQFISILLGTAGVICGCLKQRLIGSISLITSGFAGLVAWLAMHDQAVSPLMPVLSSTWLAIHVSLVMTAYALLTLSAIISSVAIFRPSEKYENMCLAVLYPALFLLSAGIFTGAVWANESWGRYWAWDPKETWALITLMVYAAALHPSIKFILRSPRALYIYLLISFSTVIMTYYGVNYLPSLHAYQ